MLWNSVLMALREIRRNLMRSSLTTLGIVIGVAAVILMVTLGEGATRSVTNEISSLGRNLVIVVPGNRERRGMATSATPFKLADARAISEEVTGVAEAAPIASRVVRLVYGGKNWATGLTGTTDAFFRVRTWALAEGRTFNPSEESAGAAVCILGQTVRTELFGAQDPLGARLRVAGFACRVVGVLEPKGRSTFGQDQDDFIAVPIETLQRRVAGNDDVSAIFVSAVTSEDTPRVQRSIEALMRQRRSIGPGQSDDFAVRDMKEITKVVETTTGVLTALLAAIAAVSLLVGGIGIMNIMLVSVTERTREIGIRLAIGARGREVLLQFLVEAVVLSLLGGALGIALGLGSARLAAGALKLPFVVPPQIVFIAFGFAAAVGVTFGFFPARKAARLNPIDALRYE